MNTELRFFPQAADTAELIATQVTAVKGDTLTLANGVTAKTAVSCLVTPNEGDIVLVCNSKRAGATVIQILSRTEPTDLKCNIPEGRAFRLQAEQISLVAREQAEISAGRDVEINALNSLSINSRQMLVHVSESLIQTAKHCLGHFTDWAVQAKHLIRMQGHRQLITARKEIKIDSDIIHMG